MLAFIIAHAFTTSGICVTSHTALCYCLVAFHFTLQDYVDNFLQDRFSGNTFLQLFIYLEMS